MEPVSQKIHTIFLESLRHCRASEIPKGDRRCSICSIPFAKDPNPFERAPPYGFRCETAVLLPCNHFCGLDCLSRHVAPVYVYSFEPGSPDPRAEYGGSNICPIEGCNRIIFERDFDPFAVDRAYRSTIVAQVARAYARHSRGPAHARSALDPFPSALDIVDAQYDQSVYGSAVLVEEEAVLEMLERLNARGPLDPPYVRELEALRTRRDARQARRRAKSLRHEA